MKQLILILSLTLMAGVANAGTGMSNNDCPYADKSNASSLFSKTAAYTPHSTLKELSKKNAAQGKRRGNAKAAN